MARIQLVYLYECSLCLRSEAAPHTVYLIGEVPRPCPPPTWREVNGALVCDRHEIVVTIDGRKQ
jgi:hypothetical protein